MAKIDRKAFFEAVKTEYGDIDQITRKQAIVIQNKYNIERPHWLFNDKNVRLGRGLYKIDPDMTFVAPVETTETKIFEEPLVITESETTVNMAIAAVPLPVPTSIDYIPDKLRGYVPFGHFNDVRSIVNSKRFYPIYITGLSGNGKTLMVEQVHADVKREVIRVNITIETDEDDLLGGFRLQDGRTVWQNGPVIHAMERGATLLLDEVDLGSNKLMCLQPVLEGKSVFLKKINKLITPAKGFNVIATANTKGKGSDDGRFIGTNVMNEAFLERFSITLEQEYPSIKVEAKILKNVLGESQIEDNDFVSKLVSWAEVVRKTFLDGACSEIISTRRLVHICEAYAIFGKNRMKAIELCLNRFDADTKNSFLDLYKKLDESITPKSPEVVKEESVEIPF